jgi:hypothetical protein
MTLAWLFLDEATNSLDSMSKATLQATAGRLLVTCDTYRRLWASQTTFVNDSPGVGTVLPEVVDA